MTKQLLFATRSAARFAPRFATPFAAIIAAPTMLLANAAEPAASAASTPASAVAQAQPLRYTFSWPLDGSTLQPRGGITRGAPITLDHEPSAAWKALQTAGISAQERDRRAILAMAGNYRVSFDFLEIDSYASPAKPTAPYRSWGTEKVYVDRDEPAFVSLVHILEMRIVGNDGKVSEPFVTKHWRQDWAYEPDAIVEHRGRDRWQRRTLGADEKRGAWLQTVYQVDESPRYASLGRWEHNASFSTWLSGHTLRPLPRREWSVRDDYQALSGTNRHTVAATGWSQEENNLKAVLDSARAPDTLRPYLAREYGVARYERLRDADFAQADRYFERTRAFWQRVRDAWATAFAERATITLRGPVDKLGLFKPLFEHADRIAGGGASSATEEAAVIRSALGAMAALP